MTDQLRLYLLGPWRAELNGRSLPALPTRHARLLLARLAMAHPNHLKRDCLRADLFPQSPSDSGSAHLRSTLYYLRRSLNGFSPHDLVTATRDRISFHPDLQLWVDVKEFIELSEGAVPGKLQRAMQLYQGSFLAGLGEEWATVEGQHLHQRFIDVLRKLTSHAKSAGRPDQAIQPAMRWAEEEPWAEEAHLAAITSLVALGDRDRAEQQVRRARRVLHTEWGDVESERLDRLAREVDRMPRAGGQPLHQLHRSPQPPVQAFRENLDTFDRLALVGRESLVRYLRDCWSSTCEAEPHALLIEGATGVGKSRLMAELAATVPLRSQNLVLRGSMTPGSAPGEFGLVRSLFDAQSPITAQHLISIGAALDAADWRHLCYVCPALQDVLPNSLYGDVRLSTEVERLPDPTETTRIRAAFLKLLQRLASEHPLLIILEDIQWADQTSLQLMAELLQTVRRIMVVATRRPMLSRPEGLQSFHLLHLAPLEETHMAALLQQIMAGPLEETTLARLVSRCAGLPLFAREILRALAEDRSLQWSPQLEWYLPDDVQLPDPLTDLLDQRLAQLSQPAQGLANLLAVLARPANEQLLARLLPDADQRHRAQAELLERQVLIELATSAHKGTTANLYPLLSAPPASETANTPYTNEHVPSRGTHVLRFSHDWLRQQVASRLDADTRRAAHRQILGTLIQLDGDRAERMIHAQQAQVWDVAVTDALAVAATARQQGQMALLGQALGIGVRAADQLNLPGTDERRWSLLLLREDYESLAGRRQSWLQILDEMDATARDADNVEWITSAYLRRGQALRSMGNPSAALSHIERAVSLARRSGLSAAEARARLALAVALDDLGRIPEALIQSQVAVAVEDLASTPYIYNLGQANLAYAQMRSGDVEAGYHLMSRLLDQADEQSLLYSRLLRQQGILQFACRHYDDGFKLVRRSIQLSQDLGDLSWALAGQAYLAFELANMGRYSECVALCDPLLPVVRSFEDARLLSMLLFGVAKSHAALGDAATGRSYAFEGANLAETRGLAEYAAVCLGIAADMALTAGRLPEARRVAHRLETLTASLSEPRTIRMDHVAAKVWLATGHREQARRSAQQALRHAFDEGLMTSTAVEARWTAAYVLAELDGADSVVELREQIYARFLDDLTRLAKPSDRTAFCHANPAHCALTGFSANGPSVLAMLPRQDAPTGRALHPDERVPVVWQVSSPDDPDNKTARRQQQIRRITHQAIQQGAVATVETMAERLQVSPRTVLRDLKALRAHGTPVVTRGTAA